MLGPLRLAVLLSAALLAQRSTAPEPDALLDAALTGDRARVAALLDAGLDVNVTSRYGITALGFAAQRGHFDIVRLLVERGANVNAAESFYGFRPVDFALRDGRLDIAVYLLEHGAQGATGVLYAAIRRRETAAVKTALATRQADATALATARTLAAQTGDAAIIDMVNAAADGTPATAPKILTLAPALLRSYEGRYQNAATGATVTVSLAASVEGQRLRLSADGQVALWFQPIEERRFIADGAPDMHVVFGGRGGIVERLSIVRGNTSVRYEREGFGDATSPAPDPGVTSRSDAPSKEAAPASAAIPRSAPQPWPAFRGTNAAGVADGQGAPTEWNVTTGANIRWKTPIPGLATSSPIIWGDRVIVVAASSSEDTVFLPGLSGDVTPVASLPVHSYRVYALDRVSGKVVWDREAFRGAPLTKRHTKSSQANSTPVTDGRHIVALFGSIGLMVCYSMEGTELWKKEIGVLDSGWFLDASVQWGHSSSPIIHGSTTPPRPGRAVGTPGSVIVQADQARGSFIAAFEVTTGRELWRTARADEVSTWATPTVLAGPKGDEIVTNGTKVRGYDAATGALLWTLAPNSEIAVGTPVIHRNLAIVTAGYPPVRPVYAVRAGSRGDLSLPPGRSASDAIAWSHDRDGTYISSPIVYRDQLYTLNNNGILTTYDANTGERLYRARVGGGGAFSSSPIAADGKLYLASEDGDVFIIQAGREYVELARHPMNEVMMASPALSDGLLVLRTLRHVWGIGR